MTDIKEIVFFIDIENKELIVKDFVIVKKRKLYTEAQKRATYKYREKNRAQYNEYMKPLRKNYYEKNKDELLMKKANKYLFLKELKTFRNILIDYHL